jgi:hypothetical protein
MALQIDPKYLRVAELARLFAVMPRARKRRLWQDEDQYEIWKRPGTWLHGAPEEIRTPDPQIRSLWPLIDIAQHFYKLTSN